MNHFYNQSILIFLLLLNSSTQATQTTLKKQTSDEIRGILQIDSEDDEDKTPSPLLPKKQDFTAWMLEKSNQQKKQEEYPIMPLRKTQTSFVEQKKRQQILPQTEAVATKKLVDSTTPSTNNATEEESSGLEFNLNDSFVKSSPVKSSSPNASKEALDISYPEITSHTNPFDHDLLEQEDLHPSEEYIQTVVDAFINFYNQKFAITSKKVSEDQRHQMTWDNLIIVMQTYPSRHTRLQNIIIKKVYDNEENVALTDVFTTPEYFKTVVKEAVELYQSSMNRCGE